LNFFPWTDVIFLEYFLAYTYCAFVNGLMMPKHIATNTQHSTYAI